MRISRFLCLVALICGLNGLAKADPIDFHMTVLDGPITGEYITGPNFQVNFGSCPKNNPNLSAYSACFLGINDTGGTLSSLDLTFDNTTGQNGLNGQAADCVASKFFTNINSPCYFDGSQYILDFTGGTGIPPSGKYSSFYLAVKGAPPEAFQGGEGVATITPEPSSVVLFSTGIALLGAFFANRRRMTRPAAQFQR